MSEELIDMSVFDTSEEIDPELLAEYQREIERHQSALQMLKVREQEALEAKQRATRSQQTVEQMANKFLTVKEKLAASKLTLIEAKQRSDSRDQVCKTIENLKIRAEELIRKHELQSEAKQDTTSKLKSLQDAAESTEDEHQFNESRPFVKVDFGQTIQSLQEKLAKGASQSQQRPDEAPSEREESSNDDGDQELSVESTSTEEKELLESDVDINVMVQRLEAKCASVREELATMAISEQYMRTKQAQLIAKRKEKEMVEAELRAAIREKEARDMRKKVEDLANLLAAKRDKLKATERTLEKKTNVVEKVEKILNSKERKATYIEKQTIENIVFEKKVKKHQ